MRKATALVLLALFSSSACSLRAPMKRFSTQEEAGTVHVAVQSIALFDDAYTDQLQPRFELSSADALNAISQTQVSEMERLRAVLAELNLAGQKKTVSSEKTVDSGEVTKETQTVKTEAPDLTKVIEAPDAKTLTNNAPGVTPNANVQLDQSLKYRAAAALIQEIALFNRYVRDAAVSRHTIPYVVRLLITVNPAARREPYDVYTTISLFSTGEPDYQQPVEDLVNTYKSKTRDALRKSLAGTMHDGSCDVGVEIIPLFVTDNLESSLNSSANERNLDASGGANGFFANFAVALGLRAQAIDRDRSIGRGLNGLTTISRLGDNTVQARLGAANANNEFETVARTYNVTLLALVPTLEKLSTPNERESWLSEDEYQTVLSVRQTTAPCSDLSFTANSIFRDAVKGQELPSAFTFHRNRLVASVIRAWSFEQPGADEKIRSLIALAELGRFEQFGTEATNAARGVLQAKADLRDPVVRNTLWHDLVSLNHLSGRSYGTFQLPERTDLFAADQPVTVFDDGKKATVTINGARNVTDDGLHALITASNATAHAELDETAVAISSDRHRVTFTFPSLKARLGGEPSPNGITFTGQKIKSGARGMMTESDNMKGLPVTYRLIEEVQTPAATVATITTENIKLAAGDFAIAFSSDKSQVIPTAFIVITGGTIDTVTPAAPITGMGIEAPAQGNYVIKLKNLFVNTPVRVTATVNKKVILDKPLTVRE